MSTINRLRKDPHFGPLFASVHALCWPILLWQLMRVHKWCVREGFTDALYSVNRWGFVTILFLGDKAAPSAYKPVERTFRPLTDAGWGSDLPACLGDASMLAVPGLISTLVRAAAGGVFAPSAFAPGALFPNTS